jgi:hypothetical protein
LVFQHRSNVVLVKKEDPLGWVIKRILELTSDPDEDFKIKNNDIFDWGYIDRKHMLIYSDLSDPLV